MKKIIPSDTGAGLVLVYDGECPLCSRTAMAVRIRQTAGRLDLIDARTADPSHPLMAEIAVAGINLNAGMIVRYGNCFYQGDEALHILALLGDGHNAFNRLNGILFRSRWRARLAYPLMKAPRNLLLRIRGIQPIKPATDVHPIFHKIFGESWAALPPVMQSHYANRGHSRDMICTEGLMNIQPAKLFKLLSPVLKWAGILVPYAGQNIKTAVVFESGPDSDHFVLRRTFHFPDRKPFVFRSTMMPQADNTMIEFMRCGLGWRTQFSYQDGKVLLLHRGYALRLFGLVIPLPLTLLLGHGHAEEEATSETSFRMMMEIRHPVFGVIYRYYGTFDITEVRLDG